MTILIPRVSEGNVSSNWVSESLLDCYRAGESANMSVLHSNTVAWSDSLGRVHERSAKALQVPEPQDPSKILLQFGKAAKNHYNLDFTWPFSPLQAYAIALSSLDKG